MVPRLLQHWPDEGLQNIGPAHTRGMVDGGAAVVPASVGVGASFQEDLGALQVSIHHSHVQGSLSFYVHEIHLGPFPDKEVHTVPVARGGRDSQRCAGEPATAPDRLLVDTAKREHREPGCEGQLGNPQAALLPLVLVHTRNRHQEGNLFKQTPPWFKNASTCALLYEMLDRCPGRSRSEEPTPRQRTRSHRLTDGQRAKVSTKGGKVRPGKQREIKGSTLTGNLPGSQAPTPRPRYSLWRPELGP